MIEVTVVEDPLTGDRTVTAVVPRKDLVDIKLDPFDFLVVNTPEESAADIFQSLEILARRQAEQSTTTVESKEQL
jgi:hypothetical protein